LDRWLTIIQSETGLTELISEIYRKLKPSIWDGEDVVFKKKLTVMMSFYRLGTT
jgi:hypothetical protein